MDARIFDLYIINKMQHYNEKMYVYVYLQYLLLVWSQGEFLVNNKLDTGS